MSKERILEAVVSAMPYPSQIKDWDFSSESNAVRFTWRSSRFRVTETLGVEQVTAGMLCGSDIALLVEALLKGGAK